MQTVLEKIQCGNIDNNHRIRLDDGHIQFQMISDEVMVPQSKIMEVGGDSKGRYVGFRIQLS